MKRVARLILVFMMLCILTSCKKELELYTVYLCTSNDPNVMDLDAGEVEYNTIESTYDIVDADGRVLKKEGKSWAFSDEVVELKYKRTHNKAHCEYNLDSYYNTELSLYVNFLEDSETLESVIFGEYECYMTHKPIETEQELMESCEELMTELKFPYHEYECSIRTKVSIRNEQGLENKQFDGFHGASNEEGASTTYWIYYTRYIDGMMTGDMGTIAVGSDGVLKSITFGMRGVYKDFYDAKINKEKCNELIDSTVKHMCTIEEYQLESYKSSPMLLVRDGSLCVYTSVRPTFSKNGEITDVFAVAISLLIPVVEGD